VVDHFTYVLASDGDLMEGVASEAASLAGELGLGKLICLYDDNHVTLAGATDLTFREDKARRFEAYGWHVATVVDGNDIVALDSAIRGLGTKRPAVHHSGSDPHRVWLTHKQDSFEAHGSPLVRKRLVSPN